MRFKFVPALAAAVAFVPFLAHAEDISWSYLEGGYVNTDIDGFDEEVDGFTLRGSYEFTDNVFVFAGYTDQGTSVSGFDIDVESYNLGLGYAWPLGKALDVYGKLGYVSSEADVQGLGSADDDGYSLAIGGVPDEKPMYMRLSYDTAFSDDCIDIRTGDVEAFIKTRK